MLFRRPFKYDTMQKIISGPDIKQLDDQYVLKRNISSFALMERAARAFCTWFVNRYDPGISVAVFCGTGNNGGDGLAISRLLAGEGYSVRAFFLGDISRAAVDFNKNLGIMPENVCLLEVAEDSILDIRPDVIIDAVFGAGINRPVEDPHLRLIRTLNSREAVKIAVDLPSGLPTDSVLEGEAFIADHTVSFQFPKLSLLFPEHGRYTGELHVLDIGIDPVFFDAFSSQVYYIAPDDVRGRHINFGKFSHKGTFGKVMMIGGSYGKIGAMVLAGKAALKTGSGLVSCYLPRCGVDIMQTAVPEIMVESGQGDLELMALGLKDLDRFDALGMGPGMGTGENPRVCLQYVLENYSKPLVIDADAINILAAHRHLMAVLRENMLLTPHLKEFERLVGPCKDHVERMEKARSFSRNHRCVLILKGAYTLISLPDGRQFFNSSGTQYMATGGSGDVLTGVLTSFLGQGYSPENAAICGVYHHGLAGELASKNRLRGTIASDIVESIPATFAALKIP